LATLAQITKIRVGFIVHEGYKLQAGGAGTILYLAVLVDAKRM